MRVKTEARRQTIISEAAQLFRELGYERTSMSELAKRLGGSKATLYGYFESKEVLFLAVVESLGKTHLDSALQQLMEKHNQSLQQTLQSFGEVMVGIINKPEAIELHRMVIGEAGHSDIGQRFFDIGPQRAINGLGELLQSAIESGTIRPCNPQIAAHHLMALIKAETEFHMFQSRPKKSTKKQLADMVTRALEVFMGGYSAKA